MPAARLIKASKIFVAVQKANRPREIKESFLGFDCHHSRAHNIKKAAACELIGAKKGAIFSLIYFFKSFSIYYIPHNYVIPQAMRHAIPQTHSASYPHRLRFACVSWILLWLASTQSTFLKFFRCSRFFEFDSKRNCMAKFIKIQTEGTTTRLREILK